MEVLLLSLSLVLKLITPANKLGTNYLWNSLVMMSTDADSCSWGGSGVERQKT